MFLSTARVRFNKLLSRYHASTLAQRVFSGALWSLSGATAGKALTLLSSIVAARLLGKEQFGELGIIQSSITSFGLFAGLGFGLTATKFVAQYRTTDPLKVSRILALARRITYITGIITSGLVCFYADVLSTSILAAPSLIPHVRIASILLLLGAINGVQRGALSGFEAFRVIARISFLSGLIGFLLMIIAVWIAGLIGAIWALIGSTAIACILCRRAFLEQIYIYNIPVQTSRISSEWNAVWRFSLPAVLSGLSVMPVNWACNLILVNQPHGYSEMGLLNATIQWRNIVLFIPSVLMSVSLPMLTNLGASEQFSKQGKVLAINVGLSLVIGLCAATLVTLAGHFVMASYGPDYINGRDVLTYQVFAAAIAAVIGVMGQYLISCGALWPMIYMQIIWGTINIWLTWAFRSDGAIGVSLAYLIAYLVHFSSMTAITLWKLNQQSKS